MYNKDTLFTDIKLNNKQQITNILRSIKNPTLLCISIFGAILSFYMLPLHAAENDKADPIQVEFIPDDAQNTSTSKVNSITHQKNNDPRNLEIWPVTSTNDPLSHQVLYQEWSSPDSAEDKTIDASIRQKNNQAFLKWLKQLNSENGSKN